MSWTSVSSKHLGRHELQAEFISIVLASIGAMFNMSEEGSTFGSMLV